MPKGNGLVPPQGGRSQACGIMGFVFRLVRSDSAGTRSGGRSRSMLTNEMAADYAKNRKEQ